MPPLRRPYNIRMAVDLHERVGEAAAAEGLSRNAWITRVLEERLGMVESTADLAWRVDKLEVDVANIERKLASGGTGW